MRLPKTANRHDAKEVADNAMTVIANIYQKKSKNTLISCRL